ncbi:hypothetical protein [Flagellimonas sp. 2504JD4-2]
MDVFFKNYSINIIVLLLLHVSFGQAQENMSIPYLEKKLDRYIENEGPEKVYIQTDKDFYNIGNTIWFKAYLVDGVKHMQSTKSKVLHVVLLNDQDSVIAKRKLFVDTIGASGDIKITSNLEQGIYRLRGYTRYMFNEKEPFFFEKEISIWNQRTNQDKVSNDVAKKETQKVATSKISKPRMEFFPEGGYSVSDLESNIGIKVTDSIGNGIALKGKIVDQNDTIVCSFESHDFGLGFIKFVPKAGKNYYARFLNDKIEEKFALPKPLKKGYVMTVKNRGDHVLLRVASNIHRGLAGALVVAHLRGQVIFKKRIATTNGNDSYLVKFLTDGLMDGVAHFTLFTAEGEPVCERLVFIDPQDNDTSLSLTTDGETYGNRQPVVTSLQLSDNNGLPLDGDLSMSVANLGKHLGSQSVSNIKSWLLLESDIGNTMPNPDYFFEKPSFSKKYILDAFMLTHGWRRFVWKKVLDTTTSAPLTFLPEKGIVISGNTRAFKNPDKPMKADLKLSLLGLNSDVYQENGKTDEQGRFHFGPYVFMDTAKVIIEANGRTAKGKARNVTVQRAPIEVEILPKRIGSERYKTFFFNDVDRDFEENPFKTPMDFEFDPRLTVLEGVTVSAKKKTEQDIINEGIRKLKKPYLTPDYRMFVDSTSFSVTDVLRKRGVRASRSAVYVLDGMVIDAEMAELLNPSSIVVVDAIKTYDKSGPRIAMVAMYTKQGLGIPLDDGPFPGVANFEVAGFSKTREYYAPYYGKHKEEHNRPDYRTTLHWEPFVKTTEEERNPITFYTGDNNGEYVIKVEGLTEDGRPVYGSHKFVVE